MMRKELRYAKLLNTLIDFYIWQFKIISLYMLCCHMNSSFKNLFAFYLFYPLICWSILFVCFFFLFATCFSSYPQLMTTNTHMVRLLWICHDIHFFHCSLIKRLIKEQVAISYNSYSIT